jgi:hypothetical protein
MVIRQIQETFQLIPLDREPLSILIAGCNPVGLAPKFYPVTIGVGRSVMPCWAVMTAIRGAEPSTERSAADRRISAYAFGVIQPSRRMRATKATLQAWKRA